MKTVKDYQTSELITPRVAELNRSPGTHLTDITGMLYQMIHEGSTARRAKMVHSRRKETPISDAKTLTKFEVGFLWEDVMSLALKSRLPARPGEIELDGVILSPDGVDLECDPIRVVEYKATWYSSNKRVEDIVRWMYQIKSYCYALEIPRCRFDILHICGNYFPPEPMHRIVEIDFSWRELMENWNMVKKFGIEQQIIEE